MTLSTPYINGEMVSFDGDVMSVTFFSTTRVLNAPVNRQKNRYAYTFTYSPAAKSAVNGIDAAATPAADVSFIVSLLGGVKLAKVYGEMKAAWMKAQERVAASRRTHDECTCGRCFDCVAA